ncbi:porin [Paracoccus aestuariivivens]|uniref:Porin n=1 Tax=Paracoccus aestuariivivens TaxID=1820333 RepID=A0A6L6J8B6_9RHOB|nr:porin [Paracoccus aestuariivivens]MTH78220.1 porin [Paracoccus aestuariivivens]
MKKVLFATTALVMTAGVAAAEVAVTGTGRMGVIYDGNDAQFSSRIRAIFTMTGESDAGLSFGGSIRADNSQDGNRGTAGSVWVSGTYGKLEMGDAVSASESAVGDLPAVGYTDGGFAGDLEEISYLTGDGENLDQGPNILYTYTINNISLFASASDGSDRAWFTTTGDNDNVECTYDPVTGELIDCSTVSTDDTAWSVGANYEAENFTVGLGYAKSGDAEEIVLGGNTTFAGVKLSAVYADYQDRNSISFGGDDATGNFVDDLTLTSDNFELGKTWGLGAEWQQDALRVAAFYRRDELRVTDAGAALDLDDRDFDSFGVGADYDLGGGAVVSGGIVDSDWLNDTVADMGVKFKF